MASNIKLAKAIFFKAVPLCLIAVATIVVVRNLISTYLAIDISEYVYFFLGGAACSWIYAYFVPSLNEK
jgi:hypothetical protein